MTLPNDETGLVTLAELLYPYMQIAGIQKLTLVDFPGRVAATVFSRGCSFRCGFCHNPELVLPDKFNPLLEEKQIFDFLESRYGKLTGICITGGEPCMQPDIDKFISHIKALGFDVKLDTNGSFPDRLEKIIKDGDVDYIAMDVKSSLPKYAMTISNFQFPISNQIPNPNSKISKKDVISTHSVIDSEVSDLIAQTRREPAQGRRVPPLPEGRLGGVGDEEGEKSYGTSEELINKIKKSIKLIMESGVPYEFRTTVCHPLHEVADFPEIGKMIKGAKKYYIQNFVKSKQINEAVEYRPFSDKELKEANKIMSKYVKLAEIR